MDRQFHLQSLATETWRGTRGSKGKVPAFDPLRSPHPHL